MSNKTEKSTNAVAENNLVSAKKIKKGKKYSVQYDNWGYFFIAPFFLVYVIFSLIPLLTTLIYSFFEYYRVGLMTVGPNWVGFKNYVDIFTAGDSLATYFKNTFIMWMMGFIPQIVISLILAVWFTNTELRLKCQQFFKTVIYMPNLIMAAAFSMLFFNLFSPNGPVNNIVMKIVDDSNMPKVTSLISAAISQLNDFVKNNSGDSTIAAAVSSVVNYLSSVELPKGLKLADTIKFVEGIANQATEILRNNYSGSSLAGLEEIITKCIHVDAKPMEAIRFFSSTGWTRTLVAAMNFLMWYGNTTILLMAGVMGIDNSLFEAARIDGANPLQIFFKITIPLLLPIFVYVLITSLIGGIQMFDVPQILTNGAGAPDRTTMTIIMKLNKHLTSKNYGPAGATSLLIFAITGVLSGIVYKTTMQQYQNKR